MQFNQYLDLAKSKPFRWGEHDCQTLINNWLRIRYPGNKLPQLTYTNNLGAYRQSVKFDWLVELGKAFRISFVEDSKYLQSEDIILEIPKQKAIQSAHFVFGDSIVTLKPCKKDNQAFRSIPKAYVDSYIPSIWVRVLGEKT